MADANDRRDWPAFPINEKEDDGSHYNTHTGMNMLEFFAAHAPISFAEAVNAYGGRPNLGDDGERAAFFAIWAFLRIEFAKAMVEAFEGEPA